VIDLSPQRSKQNSAILSTDEGITIDSRSRQPEQKANGR
jgi:hypothetical protein